MPRDRRFAMIRTTAPDGRVWTHRRVEACLNAWDEFPAGSRIDVVMNDIPLRIEESAEEAPQQILVVDGGMSAEALLKGFHDAFEWNCLSGDCWQFALIAAEHLPNLGLYAFLSDGSEDFTHAGLSLPGELVFDATGVSTEEEFQSRSEVAWIDADGDVSLELLTRSDLLSKWTDGDELVPYENIFGSSVFEARMRLFVEAVAVEYELDFSPLRAPPVDRLLVLVHPGSMCGSADMHLGRDYADASRRYIARELAEWVKTAQRSTDGSPAPAFAVLHGELSDELPDPRYDDFHKAIRQSMSEMRAHGAYGIDRYGCDHTEPRIGEGVGSIVEDLGLDPAACEVSLTGAWFDPLDQGGCVNAVRKHLRALGFEVRIMNSAATLDDGPIFDREREEPLEESCSPSR